jgi:hypothetical protein
LGQVFLTSSEAVKFGLENLFGILELVVHFIDVKGTFFLISKMPFLVPIITHWLHTIGHNSTNQIDGLNPILIKGLEIIWRITRGTH